jgi:glutamine amidotransferase
MSGDSLMTEDEKISIGLMDYGMGNVLSVSKAFEFVGAAVTLSSDPAELAGTDALVLPGVGNFGDGMRQLSERSLDSYTISWIESGKPFMGICLGMQLLMERSEEAPGVSGLGVFKGDTIKFPETALKVPHMGWNQIKIKTAGSARFAEVPDGSHFYFVHSYIVRPDDESVVACTCEYGIGFAAALSKDNVFATQFHPEKSQDCGLRLLRNFLESVSLNGSRIDAT